MVTHTGIEKPAPRVRVPQGKNSPADCFRAREMDGRVTKVVPNFLYLLTCNHNRTKLLK